MRLPVLYYFFLLVVVFTAFVGGLRYRSLTRPLRILEWLAIISVIEAIGKLILISFGVHTLWVSHFYTPAEFALIVFMYSCWIKLPHVRLILFVCFAVFIIFWIICKWTLEPFTLADDWTATFSKVFQIIFSAYLLVELVKDSDIEWTNSPLFWVTTSIIIYSAGSLFMYALYNKMLQESFVRLRFVMSLNWILMIISNLFFIKGFLCKE
jgi:hypothetical protein